MPEGGRPTIAFDWYRSFLEWLYNTGSHTWFGPLVSWGELLVGVGLILGAFVGIAGELISKATFGFRGGLRRKHTNHNSTFREHRFNPHV